MKRVLRPAALPLAIALACGCAPAYAAQFSFPYDIQANIDTTLSYGVAWRAQGAPDLMHAAQGGSTGSAFACAGVAARCATTAAWKSRGGWRTRLPRRTTRTA